MATVDRPVRPPAPILERLIHAAALPRVGYVRLQAALAADGGPQRGLDALIRQRERRLTETERERAAGWAERALATIREEGFHVLLPGDPRYPPELARLERPPLPLFGKGRLCLLDEPLVGIVGTRRASAYGKEAAHRIASGIAAAGVGVISGLAAGIDGQAHTAAGAARTVAVLGCGLDVVYPKQHRRLQAEIGRKGLLLSEQLPGTPPARHHFPLRNRIIAALARGLVVVEAPARSGALSTAKRAREQGRDVFAVPGAVHDARSVGSNELIRDGGVLVTSAREVLEGLKLPLPPEDYEADLPPAELEGQGLALWRAVRTEPIHVDRISAEVGLAPHLALASLLSLEVRGHVRQLPGMRFVRS